MVRWKFWVVIFEPTWLLGESPYCWDFTTTENLGIFLNHSCTFVFSRHHAGKYIGPYVGENGNSAIILNRSVIFKIGNLNFSLWIFYPLFLHIFICHRDHYQQNLLGSKPII
uniref:Uncharacterized protein n=1 Tax=Cacopsylla melanoneura TaxID=428564 RepID=A0A8D8PL99_9HEMI